MSACRGRDDESGERLALTAGGPSSDRVFVPRYGPKTFLLQKEVSHLAITRQKKEELSAGILAKIQKSQAVYVTSYQGMTMPQFNALRRKLREWRSALPMAICRPRPRSCWTSPRKPRSSSSRERCSASKSCRPKRSRRWRPCRRCPSSGRSCWD
ncbi:MAG: 50S ribosomal protein L10 [Chloroflexi bacterium]|nr:50S ribosomal protein L10 [Chloroflexota bacterium]